MAYKSSLSISMIVKNEEKHIGRILENAHIFADEVIILDTGSTDKTIEIAQAFGATIQHFDWCYDFAKARNASLSYCTKDFVMWLDADDLLPLDDAIRLRNLLSEEILWDVLYLPYYYNYTPDNPAHGKRKKSPRIFRNHIGVTWKSPIHEYLVYPKNTKKNRQIDNIVVYHYPLRESSSNSLRNLFIMHKASKDPDNLGSSYHFWHIAKEYSVLGNQKLAIKYYHEAIKLGIYDLPLMRSRQYYGLGKQYKRIKEYSYAIEAQGLAIVNYPFWREPFVAIAECYIELGLTEQAFGYLNTAENIPLHSFQVERSELYEGNVIADLKLKIASRLTTQKNLPISSKTYTLMAGGDLCLGRQMPDYIAIQGAKRPLESIRTLTETADIFLANLECVISNTGEIYNKEERRPFYYRGNPIVIDVLVNAGINVVTTANNHAMDYGANALFEQKELLTACNIANPGSGETLEQASVASFIQVDDVIIAIISIDTESNLFKVQPRKMGINTGADYHEIKQRLYGAIAHAQQFAHLIVVSPHWGLNWKSEPTPERIQLAHDIIDAGADLILGHSAHILQGIEIYKHKAIIYDMGSLLFDRVAQDRMKFSALFQLDFTKHGFKKLNIYPLLLKRARATIAKGEDANYIKLLLKNLSQMPHSQILFNEVNGYLELDLAPPPKSEPSIRALAPEFLYTKKFYKKLPKHYLDRPNCANISPDITKLTHQNALTLNNGLTYLGSQFPAIVRSGYAFIIKLFFKAANHFEGHWQLTIYGHKLGHDDIFFEYQHPITEGVYPAALWKENDFICDECIVRPPSNITEGEYLLSWQIYNRNTNEKLSIKDAKTEQQSDKFNIGTIRFSNNAPKGVVGA